MKTVFAVVVASIGITLILASALGADLFPAANESDIGLAVTLAALVFKSSSREK